MIEITLSPLLAKFVLRINPFNRFKVMCLGYEEDYELFTELVWEDDKDLDYCDRVRYPKFQLWYI